MKIFGMGGLELVIILVVILLIFGPKNLPKLGSAFGKTVSNLRAGMNEGKKKKEDEEAKAEEAAEGTDGSAPAELEAHIEDAAEEVVAEAEEAVEEVADAVQGAADEAAAATDEGAKKVKRVVRKKVASEEPAE